LTERFFSLTEIEKNETFFFFLNDIFSFVFQSSIIDLANLSVGLEKKKLKMFASKKRGKDSNEIILKAKAKKMCHT
jgi:hypothetical protein